MDDREADLGRETRFTTSSDNGDAQGGSEELCVIGAGDAGTVTDNDGFIGPRAKSGSVSRLCKEASDSLLACPLGGLGG